MKPDAQLQLLSFSAPASGIKATRVELFIAPGKAEELLEQPIVANFSSTMVGVLIRQGIYLKEAPHLYLYDLKQGTYCGFLDLNKLLGKEAYR